MEMEMKKEREGGDRGDRPMVSAQVTRGQAAEQRK